MSAELEYAALLIGAALAYGLFSVGRWYQRRLDAAEWREAAAERVGRHRAGVRRASFPLTRKGVH